MEVEEHFRPGVYYEWTIKDVGGRYIVSVVQSPRLDKQRNKLVWDAPELALLRHKFSKAADADMIADAVTQAKAIFVEREKMTGREIEVPEK